MNILLRKFSKIILNFQNGGNCSSKVIVLKKIEISEFRDTVFNSPGFVQVKI